MYFQVIYNNLCPQWNEFFRVSVCHYAKKLHFRVKDQDELGTDQVGEVCIPVEALLKKPKLTINGKFKKRLRLTEKCKYFFDLWLDKQSQLSLVYTETSMNYVSWRYVNVNKQFLT